MPVTLQQLQEDFPTPWDLLITCDFDFTPEGEFELYPWQAKILDDFANPEINKSNPYKATLVAANGVGKDKVIIAPCALWLALTSEHAVCVITSASGQQLDKQTDKYIRLLATRVNSYYGEEVVIIQYRKYQIVPSQATMELFATDEAGRAEGWHPTVGNSRLGIFVSEAKTISNDIFDALHRCRGCSHRLDASSPGPPIGHFYESCFDPAWTHYKVTAFEAPNITVQEIAETRTKYGEHSPFYKSSILAEFAVTDEPVVIPRHFVDKLQSAIVVYFPSSSNIGGLDLALSGGAETTLAISNGNKIIAFEAFRIPEETALIAHLESLFYKYNLDKPGSLINADAGGLGKPILQHLVNRGWKNINFYFNQSTPSDQLAYANLGTELWFSLKILIENCQVIIPFDDDKLIKQLTSRYYVWSEQTKKAQLESKLKMRARGQQSPDRADALVLSFADLHYEEREENRIKEAPGVNIPYVNKAEPRVSKLALDKQSKNLGVAIQQANGAMNGQRKLPDHIREQLIQLGYGQRNDVSGN